MELRTRWDAAACGRGGERGLQGEASVEGTGCGGFWQHCKKTHCTLHSLVLRSLLNGTCGWVMHVGGHPSGTPVCTGALQTKNNSDMRTSGSILALCPFLFFPPNKACIIFQLISHGRLHCD